jgi:excinuclease ABC subunit A
MKSNNSVYIGIKTNNLKNIDFTLPHNKITLLMGSSGSGKSSLAVETIHKISFNELSQLMNLSEEPSNYSIDEYFNILPSIALIQDNYNKNPRSTIATYFKIDIFFKKLFSTINKVPSKLFQFNKFDTACEKCLGTGIEFVPDITKIIDNEKEIKNIPFKNWQSSYKDFYSQILKLFCKDNDIDIEKKFNDLDIKSQEKLLYGVSEKKYKINYKLQGKKRVRTTQYIGPIIELKSIVKPSDKEKKYFSQKTCSRCNGFRFSKKVLEYKIYNKNLGELYSLQIDELISWIKEYKNQWQQHNIEKIAFNQILIFLEKMIDVKLEYLNLNRSIPSLSGGELQRLRFAKAINSQFNNFLYIFDEPSSGLHPSELNNIITTIKQIKNNNNTILIIEHNEIFKKVSDNTIILGGENGGEIVENYKKEKETIQYNFFQSNSNILIQNESYNNIHNLNIEVPIESLIAICGKSGSGKTSFAKFILPKYCKNPTYLDQTPINGNKYSILATYLGIFDEIKKLFAKENKIDIDYFSFYHTSIGKCNTCKGTGVLKDEVENINIICPSCEGKRFSSKTLKYKVNNLNIYEYLSLPISELIKIIPISMKKTKKVLNFLLHINLGYISLFREIATLSGGESQRVKLGSTFFKYQKNRTYILDEPFRGLDVNSKYKLISFLYDIVKKGNTIFFIEHDILSIYYSSYIIEFGPNSGINGGKVLYVGEKRKISNATNSIIKDYLED